MENLRKDTKLVKPKPVRQTKRHPSNWIGFVLLVAGVISMAASIYSFSLTLAFVGLSLTFWGALFLFIRPTRLVRTDVACSAVTPFYNTVDRITDDLKCVGKPTYVPPYPKDAFLPEYLKGLKELVVFIATEETSKIPTLEMAKQQFVVYDPKGVCVIPPGSGLLNLFEQEVKTDFGKVSLDDLFIILPKLIVNNLELASGFEIDSRDKVVRVKITNSVYKDLYSHEKPLKSIQHIGCPLVSAVACALSETTGKLVVIGTINLSLKSQKIEVQYQLLEG